jgi:hypothetical protein
MGARRRAGADAIKNKTYASQRIYREEIWSKKNKMTYRDWAYLLAGMCLGATITACWIFIIT